MAMAGKNDQGKKLGLVLALAGAVGAAAYVTYRKYATKKASAQQLQETESSHPQTERVEDVISTGTQRKRIEATPPPSGNSEERSGSTNSDITAPPASDDRAPSGSLTPLARDDHHFGNGETSGNDNGTLETKEENDVIVVDKSVPRASIAKSSNVSEPSGSLLSESDVGEDVSIICKEEVQQLQSIPGAPEHQTDSKGPQSCLSVPSSEGTEVSFDGSIITEDQLSEMQGATNVEAGHVSEQSREEVQSLSAQAPPAEEPSALTPPERSPGYLTDTSFDGSIITQEQIQDIPSDSVEQHASSQESGIPKPETSWMSRFDGSVINPEDDQEEDCPRDEHDPEHPTSAKPEHSSNPDDYSTSENSSGSDDDVENSCSVWMMKPGSDEDMVDFGIRIKTEEGDEKSKHSVEELQDGSPAEQIGLRKGDEIMRLNGMCVNQWRHDVLMEQFRLVPADDFDMTLKRQVDDKDIYKDVKARLQTTDEGVAVSSEEMDVSESQVELDRDIIIAAYNGQDRKRACRIKRAGSEQYIRAIGHKLDVVEISDESEQNFIFRREMFNCIDKCPDSPYFEKRIYVFVFRAGQRGAQQGFLTALTRGSVGLQRKDRLRRHPHSLSRADARFFIHHFTASGFDCFESTQLPGHYLACNHGRVYLKWVPSDKDRDLSNEVHFIVKYL